MSHYYPLVFPPRTATMAEHPPTSQGIPLDKLLANWKKHSDESRPKAVLLCTGAYCPVHYMHIEMFEKAKKYLEERKYVVLAGYLSPSHDFYVEPKLARSGVTYIPSKHRIEIIRLATKNSDWLSESDWSALERDLWITHK